MQPFDDQSINEEELPLELNPNLVPNLSYFSTPTPPTFYASSSFDNHALFGSIAVENASVPSTAVATAAAAAAAACSGDTRKGTRKGRHSKICTAKGPRDRRMRLSIDVARNFFRLQDMLGFDKASNTVQWLLTMSKAAIKELASVSSSKICTFLGNPSFESTESSTLRGDEAASGSKKAASKTKAKKEAAKPSKKITELHSAQAKELRAKARERARERTREKQRMLSNSSFPITLDPMNHHDSSFHLKTLLEFANRQVEGGDICALPSAGNMPADTIPVMSNSQAAMAELNMASYMFEEQWEMEALSMYSR
ncbi:transcription factor TEOSINTE BRANCHED 1-like [Zingiber officinale]|uniref:Uncharacterized protein n=1 Tax=Zingiber officinale TaxID=94328 RepID=A0A8J5FP91_ZINOF|nr:transcription factor TEOSINTE BRANCHED 1-like [Zingiber officinale]KAG6488098.1 hypothetical protein ZIOFF_056856 [Zingiber officinale]